VTVEPVSATLKPDTRPPPPLSPGLCGIFWTWRWEISSSIVSMTSMALVLAILVNIRDMALSDWPLPIQPNSLIAVCTTLGKSAMMVPVASCIGQLKWRYFARRPRPLQHLQSFDDASRGPWGSLVVLLSGLTRSWVISGFAFAAIVSLRIEPSAQQVLAVGTRELELTNMTADVGMARGYILLSREGAAGGWFSLVCDFSLPLWRLAGSYPPWVELLSAR
jgi:hypothetical protein